LKFSSIVVRSLQNYRVNPLLALPALIGFLVSLISGNVYYSIIQGCSLQAATGPCLMSFSWYYLVDPVIQSVVGLFLILGSVGMTEQIMLGYQASLEGWVRGIRLHFVRVFIILLVFGVIELPISIAGAMGYSIFILPRVLSQTLTANFVTEFTRVDAWASMTWHELLEPLMSFLAMFAYLCLASAVLDRRGLRASFSTALGIVKRNGGLFFSFLLLIWAVDFMVGLSGGAPSLIGITQPTFGASTLSSIVSSLARTVISPFWYLIAFAFYTESRT